MKRLATFAALALFSSPALLLAEPPKVEHVVALLEQAKTAPAPLPLLEQARAEFKKFEPTKVHEKAIGKQLAKLQEDENAALVKHRHEAEQRINQAIATVKAGGKPASEISAAIANVHLAGSYKR